MIKPIIRDAVEGGIGEGRGGVGFAEIEFDAPGMGGLGLKYFVRANTGDVRHAHVRLTMAVDQLNAIATQLYQTRGAIEDHDHKC